MRVYTVELLALIGTPVQHCYTLLGCMASWRRRWDSLTMALSLGAFARVKTFRVASGGDRLCTALILVVAGMMSFGYRLCGLRVVLS